MDDTADDEALWWPDEATVAEGHRDWFERRLKHLKRAWESGSLAAIGDAIRTCKTHGMPPPEWLADAVHALALERETKEEAERRFETHVHLTRWSCVQELRERAAELREFYRAAAERRRQRLPRKVHQNQPRPEALRPENLAPEIAARRREQLIDAEHMELLLKADRLSWDDTYDIVALALKGTEAEGAPSSIKRSYQVVEADMKRGTAKYPFLSSKPVTPARKRPKKTPPKASAD
jgi:hypothetical protein